MSVNQAFLDIILKIVTKQNERLLSEISLRENIPYKELYNMFLKDSKKDVQLFITQGSVSSSSDKFSE